MTIGNEWKTLVGYKSGDSINDVRRKAGYKRKMAMSFNRSLLLKINAALKKAENHIESKKKKKTYSHVGGHISNNQASALMRKFRSR